jgi:hypothetical protein
MIHKHHRKRRSQGGDDSPVNVINIPDSMHQWIHDNPEKAYELGLLVKSHDDPSEVEITIPETLAKKARPRLDGEARKTRKTISVKVPNTAEENGAEIWDDLIDQVRERFAPEMNWKEDVPVYFVITAALYALLQSK